MLMLSSHISPYLPTPLSAADPNDDKNVMFEIRAGTGGDEAASRVPYLQRIESCVGSGSVGGE